MQGNNPIAYLVLEERHLNQHPYPCAEKEE